MTQRIEAMQDVTRYPRHLLYAEHGEVHIAVSYQRCWQDGFGARGWKLDVTIGDPVIIASTRQTGERIPTSVFVHDVLDHLLSGFGVSGHRSEAMALYQLYRRTGSDPRTDYVQLIEEDLFNGNVNGETMAGFLPTGLSEQIADHASMTDRQLISRLAALLGRDQLVASLVDHFIRLGESGDRHARASWDRLGLDDARREPIGLALQTLLEDIDRRAEVSAVDAVAGWLTVSDEGVGFSPLQTDDVSLAGASYPVV